MKNQPAISRRELLKLLSLAPLLALPGETGKPLLSLADASRPNIVVLLFDTWSASHLPFYGYPRNTMLNLTRFLDRATVYHSHYSTANFTSPSTASILTSRYPWQHRAFNLNGEIIKDEVPNNIFSALEESPYTRMGFSQNPLAEYIIDQFSQHIEQFPRADASALVDYFISDDIFRNDFRTASITESTYLRPYSGKPLSFFFSLIDKYIENQGYREFNANYRDQYPLGPVAYQGRSYLLPDMMDWVQETVTNLIQPTVSYIHLFPPHEPYRPSADFLGMFEDGWKPIEKPTGYFTEGFSQADLNKKRQTYDEFVANVDAELGRVLSIWENSGVLDRTILMLTSDHGELFERGIFAHGGATLYQGLINIPLIVSSPGQTERQDIFTPTSNVDLLPTIMHLTDQPIPDWCEGSVMPPYADPDPDRIMFATENRGMPIMSPIRKATIAAIQGEYKYVHYMGYDTDVDLDELFDVNNDPEELQNLVAVKPDISASLKHEILQRINESNKKYE
jgi:hypothetical protein